MSIPDDFERLAGGVDIDPYPIYAGLRADYPVMWSPTIEAWIISRWADVTRCFEDEDFFEPHRQKGTARVYGRVNLHMSGEEHRKKTAILAKRLRRPRYLNGDIKDLVSDLVAECASHFTTSPNVVDLKETMTSVVPLQVIGDLMALREAAAFPQWYRDLVAASVANVTGDPIVDARGQVARQAVHEFVTPRIETARTQPGDNLLGDLATAVYDGEPLNDTEVRDFCTFLMVAGIETTDRGTVNLLTQLIERPDQWELLRASPELMDAAIAEGLRRRPPVHGAYRNVGRDVMIGDQAIAAGEDVFLLLGSANHDETVFANPDEFDVRRFESNSYTQYTQAGFERTFGGGKHTCTGSLLAKLELEQMLSVLLERYARIEYAGEVPRDRGFVLRSPNELRVCLQAAS